MNTPVEHSTTDQPLTMIVRHQVDSGKTELFDRWAKGIRQAASNFAGFLGTEVIRPVASANASDSQLESDEYVCIIRFESYGKLKQWVDSPERRQQWISQTNNFSSQPPRVEHYQSLEFWFDGHKTDDGLPAAKAPPRYKMALLSFLVIWIQVTLLVPIIADWIGEPFVLVTAVAVATIVLLTTYLFMPLVTRLLKGWLFK